MDEFTSQLITHGAAATAGAAEGLGRAAVASIESRLRQARESKDQAELIRVQSEIITELSTQCDDLTRGFEALRSQFVAQRLQGEQLEWISTTLLPAIRELAALGAKTSAGRADADPEASDPEGDEDGGDAKADEASPEQMDEALTIIERLLEPSLLEVLQVLGFNYQRAIGEPLTEVLRRYIMQFGPGDQPSAPAPAAPSAQGDAPEFSLDDFAKALGEGGSPFGRGF